MTNVKQECYLDKCENQASRVVKVFVRDGEVKILEPVNPSRGDFPICEDDYDRVISGNDRDYDSMIQKGQTV